MSVLTVRMSPELGARLNAAARRRHMTRSSLVRQLIQDALDEADGTSDGASCADLMDDLIGCFASGIPDLATQPRYLAEALLEDHARDQPTDAG